MDIIAITISVNYSDILQYMLHQNSRFLYKWYIITAPQDIKTINLIENLGKDNIHILIYNGFYINGSTFNYGGARLFAQQYIDKYYTSANILFLDSDIYLPDNFMEKLPKYIENNKIYGVLERLDYWTVDDYTNNINLHVYNWGNKIVGFFQLYKQNKSYKYKNSYNCSESDLHFKNSFPKHELLNMSVKHLGRDGVNWNGRIL